MKNCYQNGFIDCWHRNGTKANGQQRNDRKQVREKEWVRKNAISNKKQSIIEFQVDRWLRSTNVYCHEQIIELNMLSELFY